jgi:hypothetical protein
MVGPEEAVQETLARARRLFASGSGTTLGILKEAESLLTAKLHAQIKKGGGSDSTFTGSHAFAWKKQIQIVNDYLVQRMKGLTDEQATQAIQSSIDSTVNVLKSFEQKFTGISQPLALDTQQTRDEVVRGSNASLLRSRESSWNRYGESMVKSFETTMRVGEMAGLKQHEMISFLIKAGAKGGITAESLHQKEPQYFPAPTGYVRKRYWAERIIRTETVYAYNVASVHALAFEQQTDFPDLKKKILAMMGDPRTAEDSIAVHGQVRGINEYFRDGAGREYMHPPARPNDRETVIPWRDHWGEVAKTAPPSPTVQAQAAEKAQAAAGQQAQQKETVQSLIAQAKAEAAARSQARADARAQKQMAAEQAAKIAAEEAKAAKLAARNAQAQLAFETLKGTGEDWDSLLKQIKGIATKKPSLFTALHSLSSSKPMPKTIHAAAVAIAKKLNPALVPPKKPKKVKPAPVEQPVRSQLTAEQLMETWVEGQKGSNEGGVYLGSDGVKRYVKVYSDQAQAIGEHVANRVYSEMRLGALQSQVARGPDGKWIYASEIVEGKTLQELGLTKGRARQVAEGLVADVLTANWDAVGLSLDNVLFTDRGPMRIDNGGALLMRAKAGRKPEGALYGIDELDGFFNSSKNPAYAKVMAAAGYSSAYDALDVLKGEAEKLKRLDALGWEAVVGPLTVGLPDADRYMIREMLSYRSKALQRKIRDMVAESQEQLEATAEGYRPARVPKGLKWSRRYRVKERAEARLEGDWVDDIQHPGEGSSLAVVADGKGIENQQIRITREDDQWVARFKLTNDGGAQWSKYAMKRGLRSKSDRWEFNEQYSAPAGTVFSTEIGGASARWSIGGRTEGGDFPAMAGVVEIKTSGGVADLKKAIELVMGNAERPSKRDLDELRKRKAVASIDDEKRRDSARHSEPLTVEERDIYESIQHKHVARGITAPYSEVLARKYEEAGVKMLTHEGCGGSSETMASRIVTILKEGLLSSRERYQRGKFIKGASTSVDFETGGADGVFVRMRTGAVSSGGSMFMVEIDPSEMGRMDKWAFNDDRYGRADPTLNRVGLKQVREIIGNGSLSSSNEVMFQGAIAPESFRAVRAGEARSLVLEKLRREGITEINGIPIEEFITP